MAYYRAYILNGEGHIMEAIDLDCADDTAAIESARQFVDGHDVELWQEARVVTRLTKSHPVQKRPR